jgi:hypothetical protein
MKAHGTVTLATDSVPYRDQMLSEFAAWPSDFPEPFFVTELASYGESFFADLWMKRGRELFYLRYQNALD